MLTRIISGGQTGADQAALRAARRCGLATGGWAPKGWLTEAGPAPWLADYGLVECPEPGYPARTERNASAAEATLWFGDIGTAGYGATYWAATERRKPFIPCRNPDRPDFGARWLTAHGYTVVNVAGNRESKAPGIGAWVEGYLVEVFTILGFPPVPAGRV